MSQTFDVSVSANVSANVTHAGSTLSGFESASFPMDGRIAQVSPGFGILYVLVLVAALVAMHASSYTVEQPLASAALSARLPASVATPLVRSLPTRTVLVALSLLPLVACAGWAGALAQSEPDGCFVFGLGVIFVGPSVLLGAYAVGLWRNRSYQVNGRVIVCGLLAVCLPLMQLLLLVIQRPSCPARPELADFPHTALTAVTMAMSMLPVSSIVYLSRGGGQRQAHPRPSALPCTMHAHVHVSMSCS